MAATYLRSLTNPKRVKLVSTCDVCKNRKVKCDKERPECGTCKKTNRKCSYTYAALTESIRDKQSGFRSQGDSSFLQAQLNYLQNIQFGQLYEESGYLSMASRGLVNDGQNVTGMLSIPMNSMPPTTSINNFDGITSSLVSLEGLHSSNVASSIQRDAEQCQYDPTYFSDYTDFVPLAQETQSADIVQPQQNQQYQQDQQIRYSNQIDELTSNVENLRLYEYESTRYIGEGSLIMLSEGNNGINEEIIIPEMQPDLSQINDSLKILPNLDTIEQLINLYFKHVHKYFPALRQQIIWNSIKDLNKPQHLLLLNCIFFVASPFHEDPSKKDGRIYFERAEALLYKYCTQPHALTVISIILLGRHNKKLTDANGDRITIPAGTHRCGGASWMCSGIATKMLLELGLHRKFKVLSNHKEVERLRNEAFWMCFIYENLVSATFGRPNMIDETDCDIDVPNMPLNSYPMDENTKLEIAYAYLINLSRIFARVRKFMQAESRQRFLMQEDENKFRVLDAALASWIHSLPEWLKYEEITKDPNGTLLNGIGGDMHIFFYTILILLHSRYLNLPEECQLNTSHIICMHSAMNIVNYLEILLDKYPDFFALALSGQFSIDPARSVFIWRSKFDENKKAEEMLNRLEIIKNKVILIFKSYDRGRVESEEGMDSTLEWLGIPTQPRNRMNNEEINPREWEVYIADDDRNLRRKYSWIARKQSGGPFMPKRKTSSYSRSMSTSSNSSIYMKGVRYGSSCDYNPNMEDFNFTFKTDKNFDFSAFSQQPDQLPRVTLDGVLVEEPEQFIQDHKQFGGGSQYHTPLQQSPQLQPQQFNSPYQSPQLQASDFYTPLNLSPQLNAQDYNSPYQQSPQLQPLDYSSPPQLNQFGSPNIKHESSQYNSPQLQPQQYHSPQLQNQSPLLSHEELDVKHTYLVPDQLDSKIISNSHNDDNNLTWTPPQSARLEQWSQSNHNNHLLESGANTMLTPPSDFLSETSLDDNIADDNEFWRVLKNESNNHLVNSSLIEDGSGLLDGLNDDENDGLGISIENN